ncbi:MAG: hypothetical protein ABI630_04580 [Betaproteobacteria bacterium]
MGKLLAAICAALVLTLGGCASYDGRALAPGATVAQVESAMGAPALRVAQPDGGTALYFSRGPEGRHTYVALMNKDGTLRSIEQRLTLASLNKLVPGTTTKKDVTELFGPPDPYATTKLALSGREVWEYKWLDFQEKRVLWVQFSEDGILREALNSRDDFHESPGAGLP